MKILYVEDDNDVARLAVMRLKYAHPEVEVVHAESLKAALNALSSLGPFDLIVSDYELPSSSGKYGGGEFYAHIAREAPTTPFVFLSGHDPLQLVNDLALGSAPASLPIEEFIYDKVKTSLVEIVAKAKAAFYPYPIAPKLKGSNDPEIQTPQLK